MSIKEIITVPDETLKKISDPIEKISNNEKLLMIFRSQVKYTHRINYYTGTNQIKKYFNENLNLCKNLNSDLINKNLILRFHARKYGWNEDKMFLNNFPNIRIILGQF